MRFAIIKNNSVVNVAEYSSASVETDPSIVKVASDVAQIGWAYDGTNFTSPSAPVAAAADLTQHAKFAQAAILRAGQTFNVAASGSPAKNVLCDGTNETRADLCLLALYGQANPTATKSWMDNNGLVTVLEGSELVTLATEVGNWIADTYSALADILSKISSATITTFAEIDAYAWPTS